MSLTRLCGIERKALREGEEPKRIRLAADDVTADALLSLRIKHEVKPGLYSCGHDAFEVFAPIVAKRLGVKDYIPGQELDIFV